MNNDKIVGHLRGNAGQPDKGGNVGQSTKSGTVGNYSNVRYPLQPPAYKKLKKDFTEVVKRRITDLLEDSKAAAKQISMAISLSL